MKSFWNFEKQDTLKKIRNRKFGQPLIVLKKKNLQTVTSIQKNFRKYEPKIVI